MKHELAEMGGGAHALAIQIVGNSDDAADAVHDAIASVLERPERYKARLGPLRPWFFRVVRNRCIDMLRRRKPASDTVDELIDPAVGPEEATENFETSRNLQRALKTIDADQRQIVILRDYLDLPYAQIANVLDIACGTVMSRLHRARLALAKAYREIVEQCNDE